MALRRIARVRPAQVPLILCIPLRRRRSHIIRAGTVGANMLLHVVLARECLVANGAVYTLFASVLLAMASSVA